MTTLTEQRPTAPWQAVLADVADYLPAGAPMEITVREPGHGWVHRHRSSLAVAASAVALVAVVGGAAYAVLPSAPEEAPTPSLTQDLDAVEAVTTHAAPPSPTESPVVPFEQWCAQQPGGQVAAADSADPDLAVIARIEDAYYLTRDVDTASAQLADGIDLDPAAFAAAVDAIPAGTEHCVLADETAASQFRVTVIERRPGGEQKRFVSSMTTAPTAAGDAAVIAAIGPAS
ncbi:hypothetical protein [Rhodococcus sp. SORGH_AS_0301]|uniref:hypothetical protein n=1 Tax=Rhodococcus sp. SORGH_AS_0301 TaxID=3041780 RepID=UPI0027D91A53|nr:hypothetical protein [Rhodococcus sp. SORGH_AS_0301]